MTTRDGFGTLEGALLDATWRWEWFSNALAVARHEAGGFLQGYEMEANEALTDAIAKQCGVVFSHIGHGHGWGYEWADEPVPVRGTPMTELEGRQRVNEALYPPLTVDQICERSKVSPKAVAAVLAAITQLGCKVVKA